MLKKTITYTDYDGKTRTEDFYFNLDAAEIMRFEMSVTGGLTEWAKSMQTVSNTAELYEMFEKIVQAAYGVKSADGREFIKNPEILSHFVQTRAYSELIIGFFRDTNSASDFFNALVAGSVSQEPKNEKPALTIV